MAALRCSQECLQMFTCTVIQRGTTGTVSQHASHPYMMFCLLSLLERETQRKVRLTCSPADSVRQSFSWSTWRMSAHASWLLSPRAERWCRMSRALSAPCPASALPPAMASRNQPTDAENQSRDERRPQQDHQEHHAYPPTAPHHMHAPGAPVLTISQRLASITHLRCLMCRRCPPCCSDALHSTI
jgi:hypothetical protein